MSRPAFVLLLLAAASVGGTNSAAAQDDGQLQRRFHTRSIVACDVQEDACGIAVVSFPTGVPAIVPVWDLGVPGVIVANQSFPSLPTARAIIGNVGAGMSAREALRAALAADPGKTDRQFGVAVLDPDAPGGVGTASFTGAANVPETCSVQGATYAVQANLQSSAGVCQAMADAFEASGRSLALRLLAALKAGIPVGADLRGEYSANLRVVSDSWPLAALTNLSADASVNRSRRWSQDVTWDTLAYLAMLTPNDPRNLTHLTDKRTAAVLCALRRLGYYEGPTGSWSAAAEAALGAFAFDNLFFPTATVDADGRRWIDLPVAVFLVQGERRGVLLRGQ